ncbi:hypothetical protein AVEN_21162-1 [Araneus ventricosus]|uniref:Uncharacterized protein n=1 Tax=Araneus ventricosus TaxID=182803 RepID=A0A4Y2PAZ9_ARAVE|nr:hypothetical protein AVEN_21162-1 [Araneus ventricosus]
MRIGTEPRIDWGARNLYETAAGRHSFDCRRNKNSAVIRKRVKPFMKAERESITTKECGLRNASRRCARFDFTLIDVVISLLNARKERPVYVMSHRG